MIVLRRKCLVRRVSCGMLPTDSEVVQIHLCTYNEEGYVSDTMESLLEQRPVKAGDVEIYVLDSDSDDATQEIAEEYGLNVWTVPEGKLTARDWGIRNLGADIVVSADAGDIYPEGWLESLLQPFEDDKVVATFGSCKSKHGLLHLRYRTVKNLKERSKLRRKVSRLQGRNSALHTGSYIGVGGFNLAINQKNRFRMVLEEEVNLRRKMEKIGDVIYADGAVAYKSVRYMPTSPDANLKYLKEMLKRDRF